MATVIAIGHQSERVLDRLGAYGGMVSRAGSWAATAALVIIFLWFGAQKFLPFEQQGLQPIVANNPLISWLYTLFGVAGGAEFLGVFEIATGLLIAGRVVDSRLSALGGAMGAWSFVLTISCMFTTPGVIQPGSAFGLGAVGAFLVKDIVLFSACLWLAGASLVEMRARGRA